MSGATGKEPIRFVMVGVGRIAASHLQALGALPDARLTAVVEPREDVGRAVAARENVPWFADALDPEVLALADAAIITAPPNLHHGIARHFLSNGKHVLCEKPFTLRSDEAAELVELARGRGLQCMLASKFRYVDDVGAARAMIAEGRLGKVALLENGFFGRVPMADRWNATKAVGGGGVLIDNGSHSVDIARYLLGPLDGVQAQVGPSIQGLEVEDTARVLLRARSGATAVATVSWSVEGDESYLKVLGSKGTLILGWKGGRYKLEGMSDWAPFGTGYDKNAAFKGQIDNLIGAIRGTQTPRITALDGLNAVRAIEAAYEAASQDRWIPVKEAV